MKNHEKTPWSLRFENVSYFHEGQDPILENADFEFPTEQVCWVKSEEGEGKSTLLQLLAALEVPKIGDYYINDRSVRDMTFEEFLPTRIKIGYSFDYGGLLSNRTLRDNLLLPLLYHRLVPTKQAHAKVNDLIELFDFVKFADERPAHVPGRLRKLTCLLRSVVHEPELLVMDDPFVGLGAETSEKFIAHLKELRMNGKVQNLFLSSYDDQLCQKLNPVVIHIDAGQIYQTVTESVKKVANL
jgi:phospholipid/cholesterol/gamma-HCH transport system ATP-binding protein